MTCWKSFTGTDGEVHNCTIKIANHTDFHYCKIHDVDELFTDKNKSVDTKKTKTTKRGRKHG